MWEEGKTKTEILFPAMPASLWASWTKFLDRDLSNGENSTIIERNFNYSNWQISTIKANKSQPLKLSTLNLHSMSTFLSLLQPPFSLPAFLI